MKEDSTYFSSLLNQLASINFESLSAAKKIDYDLLKWTAEIRLKGTQFYHILFPPITPYAGYLNSTEMAFKQASLEQSSERKQYLKLLNEYASVQKFYLDKLRWLELRGIRLSKPEIEMTIGLIKTRQVIPERHFLYPADTKLSQIDSTERKTFQADVSEVLLNKIIPQHDSLANYLKGDYLKKASDKVGLAHYPGGKEY